MIYTVCLELKMDEVEEIITEEELTEILKERIESPCIDVGNVKILEIND